VDARGAQAARHAFGCDMGGAGPKQDVSTRGGRQPRESCLRRQSRGGRTIAKKAGAGQPGAGAQLPADWLPSARIFRVIVHWTGGSHRTSRLGRNHHHILIETSPKLIRRIPSIATNDASEVSPWLYGAQARLQRSNLRRCLKSGMPYVPKISL
jgi:hypothetical protein